MQDVNLTQQAELRSNHVNIMFMYVTNAQTMLKAEVHHIIMSVEHVTTVTYQ